MRKLILDVEIDKQVRKNYGFAFLPTIVYEAHPTHTRRYLIWLESYEIFGGNKWIIKN